MNLIKVIINNNNSKFKNLNLKIIKNLYNSENNIIYLIKQIIRVNYKNLIL